MSANRRRKSKRDEASPQGAAVSPAEAPAAGGRARPEQSETPPLWARWWFFAAILAVLGCAVYWPATPGPFVLDDFDMLESASAVRQARWGPIFRSGRPVLMLSFVANEQLAGGFNPFWFHVGNILLHCLNSVLVWGLCRSLFGHAALSRAVDDRFRPLFVHGLPLLFLLSPIQTESVAYISSRSEVLAATFYVLGLWAFVALRDRNRWATAIAVVTCFGLAALTKQDKLTLPFAVVLLDYLLLSGCDWRGLKKSLPLYGLFAVGVVAGFFVVVKPFLFTLSAGFNLDWQEYLFTQFRMYFRYMGQLLFPFGLNLDPDIAPSSTLLEHGAWLALLALAAMVAAALRFHRRFALPVFGFLFFLLTLAPTTSFYPLADFAAERRLYLPAIGFYLAVLWAISKVFASRGAMAYLALAGVSAVFGAGTAQRAAVWSSDARLWEDTVSKSPEKERARTWLGRVYYQQGRLPEALNAWLQAEKHVEPQSQQHAYLLTNLGLVHASLKQYDESVRRYRQALAINGRDGRIWSQLAVALIRDGRKEEGWRAFETAFERRITPEMHKLRGQEHFQEGRFAEAVYDFERALELMPDDPVTQRNLAVARRQAAKNQ